MGSFLQVEVPPSGAEVASFGRWTVGVGVDVVRDEMG